MIMASSVPGVAGAGDSLDQVVHVEEGATVRLTSQSAMQGILPALRGPTPPCSRCGNLLHLRGAPPPRGRRR